MSSGAIPGIAAEHSIPLIRLLYSIPGVEQVILFGSRAKGNFREGSDIDLAIQGKGIGQSGLDQFHTAYEELNLPWKVDLLVYSSIEVPALREHIDRVGLLLADSRSLKI